MNLALATVLAAASSVFGIGCMSGMSSPPFFLGALLEARGGCVEIVRCSSRVNAVSPFFRVPADSLQLRRVQAEQAPWCGVLFQNSAFRSYPRSLSPAE